MESTMALDPVVWMSRDIRAAAASMSVEEARFLVSRYYAFQEDRIRAAHRVRTLGEAGGEPHSVLDWLEGQSSTIELQIKSALDKYTQAHAVGRWMRDIKGIGPVIAAGFLANIDITRANTAGKVWAICGQVPGQKRVRGEKLSFNAALKRLSFLTGESFKRLSSDDENAYYRHVYDRRKAYEIAKNEAGDYAEQAAAALSSKRWGDNATAAFLKAGKLSPGHIDRRACRYATKLFLAHVQQVWWEFETGSPAPLPYPIAHQGHVDIIEAPHVAAFLAEIRAGRG